MDLTFATRLRRVRNANVKSKTPLETYICQWSFDSNIRKRSLLKQDANVRIGPLVMTYCCGILVRDGLVMMADTRTNAGLDNISTFRKLHVFNRPGERIMAIATAGNLALTQ